MNLASKSLLTGLLVFIFLFPLCGSTEVQTKIDSLENLLESREGLEKADVLAQIGKHYRGQYRFYMALEYYQNALRIREEFGDREAVGKSLNSIGIVYRQLEQYDKSLEYYKRSLKIKEELNDKKGIAATSNNIGVLYKTMEKWDQALEYYFKSIDFKEQLGDKEGLSKSLNNVGIIYRELGDFKKSLEFYDRSLELKKELGDKPGIARTMNNIGVVYDNMGEFGLAISYHIKSLEMKEHLGDEQGIANTLNNIGKVYSKENDYAKALEYYKKSLLIKSKINDRKGMAIGHNNIANTYCDQGDFEKAGLHLDTGLMLANETSELDAIQKNYWFRSKLYSRTQEFEKAYQSHVNYSKIKDSIQTIKNEKGATELAALRKLARREQEILFEQQSREQVIRIIGISVFIGLSFISVVVFSRFRLKQRLTRELEKSKERFSMAVEGSKAGVYEWNIKTNQAFVSPRWKELLGYQDNESVDVTLEFFMTLVHPEDAERTGRNVQKAIESGSLYENEVRIRLKNGTYRWFHDTGIIRRIKGEPVLAVGSINDIHDKKMAEQRLLENNLKLEKINEELDRFVYSASHDMRAPLSTLLGLLSLARQAEDPVQISSYLNMMMNQINIMEEFIKKVTDYSRNSRLELNMEKVKVLKQVEYVVDSFNFLMVESEIECQIEVDPKLLITTDLTRFRMILSNLITNAIKYHNPHNGDRWIKINSYPKNERFELHVSDNGIGIKEDFHEKVFDMFFWASEYSSGSGLGLYIVRETLEKLGGKISCESHPDGGTIFKVDLPLKMEAGKEVTVLPD